MKSILTNAVQLWIIDLINQSINIRLFDHDPYTIIISRGVNGYLLPRYYPGRNIANCWNAVVMSIYQVGHYTAELAEG